MIKVYIITKPLSFTKLMTREELDTYIEKHAIKIEKFSFVDDTYKPTIVRGESNLRQQNTDNKLEACIIFLDDKYAKFHYRLHEMKKSISPLGNEVPSLEDAIKWCIENMAIVKFLPCIAGTYRSNHGLVCGRRVEVRVGGYNPVERDTLEECIADIERYRRKNR